MTKIKFKVEKLIRDKMPEIMRSKNIEVFERIMNQTEYLNALKAKLIEEANEVFEADSKEELAEEIADILEVIEALAEANNIKLSTIHEIKNNKRNLKGGFEKKLYNSHVEINEDNSAINYYLNKSTKYPKI
ncbi:MAG: nucleoside triphosphate pyrophosphohydrolase [Alphaproteobacteria bacterium]